MSRYLLILITISVNISVFSQALRKDNLKDILFYYPCIAGIKKAGEFYVYQGHKLNYAGKKLIWLETNEEVICDSSKKEKIDSSKRIIKSRLEFPLFIGHGDPKKGYDPVTYGKYITSLQKTLKVAPTGIIDQVTIDSAKSFINNVKYKQFFSEPIDQDSIDILDNTSMPGITSKLYNSIMSANAARLRYNIQAKTPQQIIN